VTAGRRFAGMIVLIVCAGTGWSAGVLVRSHGQVREVPVPELAGAGREGAGMRLARPGGVGVPLVRIFGDYECPACQALERLTGDSLRVLARAGRIRLIYHHAPLRTHRRAEAAAETAYCALDAGAGWPVHSALYGTAAEWSRSAEPDRSLVEVAVRMGADADVMIDCMHMGRAADRVRRDRDLAVRLHVQAVPTVFIDAARIEFRSFGALLRHVSRRAEGP